MDYNYAGGIIASLAIGAYTAVQGEMTRRKSAKNAEVLAPSNDKPNLYDVINSMKSSIEGLGTLLYNHRTENLSAIADVKRDINNKFQEMAQEMDRRLNGVETSIKDYHTMDERIRALEASHKALAVPTVTQISG